ncbi:hypothetical protein LSTR_LSTR008861 [Laodelphax striatellus]|uniref:Uncharacterized protein n=1 Tax=Laodelphax striatellus TaxID=195883 RepID=A0A482WTB4_LAOST|nr:hypothetical protein LSTR_LSTR008861 [Laodelphax striatellus]
MRRIIRDYSCQWNGLLHSRMLLNWMPALKNKNVLANKACFSYAKDLVLFIRNNFGNYFKIFVAGYPSGHSDILDRNIEIQYLKDKVDAGADYIITQTVFNASEFVSYVKRCRKIGINVPIIPGIMPVQNAKLLLRLDNRCKFHFTEDVYNALITYKDSEEYLIEFGIQKAKETILEIVKSGIEVQQVHFFTINSPEPTMQVWEEVKEAYSKFRVDQSQ